MPKSLIRFVALLLVPCLVADPSVAQLARPNVWRATAPLRHPSNLSIAQTRFEEEAFSLPEETSWHPLHPAPASWFRRMFGKPAAARLQPRLTNPTRTSDKVFNPGRALDYESIREELQDLPFNQWVDLIGATLPGIYLLDPSVTIRDAAEILSKSKYFESKETLFKSLDIFLLPLLKGGRLITDMTWDEVKRFEWFLNEAYGFICDQIGRKREHFIFDYPTGLQDPNAGLAIRYRPDKKVFEVRPEGELTHLYPVLVDSTGQSLKVVSSVDEKTSTADELQDALGKALEIHAHWRTYLSGKIHTREELERELVGQHARGFDFEVRPGGHDYVEIDFSGPKPVIVIPGSRIPDPRSVNYEWQKKRLAADLVSELNHLFHPEISPDKADAELEPESLLMLVAYYGLPIAFKELHESFYGLFVAKVTAAYEVIEEFHSDILKKDKTPLDQVAFLRSETGKELMDLIFTPDLWTWENDFILNPDGSRTSRVKNPVKNGGFFKTNILLQALRELLYGNWKEHQGSPFYGMDVDSPPRRTHWGFLRILQEGKVPIFTSRPRHYSSRTPMVYMNTGGIADLFFILQDKLYYNRFKARPHGLYWLRDHIAMRLARAGYAIWHVTGADIENPGATHRESAAIVSDLRVASILRRMRWEKNMAATQPLYFLCMSLGATQTLRLLASHPESFGKADGFLFVNPALQFTPGAAKLLKHESYIRTLLWQPEWRHLLPLMPGTAAAKEFQELLQKGLPAAIKPGTPVVFLSTLAPDQPDRNDLKIIKFLYKRYATPNTDWVVDPNLARGLGPDGKTRIPGSSSIVVQGIHHFAVRDHPMTSRLQEDLMKVISSGKPLSEVPVEVNGRIVGNLSNFTPEHPLMLRAFNTVSYDIVRLGPSNSLMRWGRFLLASLFLPMSEKEKGITGAPLALFSRIPEHILKDPEALKKYIDVDVPTVETFFFLKLLAGGLLLTQLVSILYQMFLYPYLSPVALLLPTGFGMVLAYTFVSFYFGGLHDIVFRWKVGTHGIPQWIPSPASVWTRVKLGIAAWFVHLPLLGGAYFLLKIWVYLAHSPQWILPVGMLTAWLLFLAPLLTVVFHGWYNTKKMEDGGAAMTFGHKRGAAKKLQVPRPVATDKKFLKDFGKLIKRLRENKGWKPADLSRETGITPKQLAEIEAGRRWLTEEGRGPALAKALGYDHRPFYRDYEVISWVSNPNGTRLYVTPREAIIYYTAKNNVTHGMLEEWAKLGSPQLEDYLDSVRPIRPPLVTMVKIKNALKGLELEIRDPRPILKQLMQEARAEKRALAREKKSPSPLMAPSSKSIIVPTLLEGGMLSPSHGVFSKIRSHSGESLDLTFQVPTELEYEKAFPPTLRAFSIQWRRMSVERRFSNGKMEPVTEDEESVAPGQFWVTYEAVMNPPSTPPTTLSFRFPKIIKGKESWPVFEQDLRDAGFNNPRAIMNQGVMWVKNGSQRIEQQPYDVLKVLAGTLSKLLSRPVSVAEMLNAIRMGEENIHLAVPPVLRTKIDDEVLQLLGRQEYDRVREGLARMYGYLPSTMSQILPDELIAKVHFEAMLGNPLRLLDREGRVFELPSEAQKAILQYVTTIPAFLGIVQSAIEEMNTSLMSELSVSLVNLVTDLKDVRDEEGLQQLSQYWDETMGTVIPVNLTLEDHMRLLQRAVSLESKLVDLLEGVYHSTPKETDPADSAHSELESIHDVLNQVEARYREQEIVTRIKIQLSPLLQDLVAGLPPILHVRLEGVPPTGKNILARLLEDHPGLKKRSSVLELNVLKLGNLLKFGEDDLKTRNDELVLDLKPPRQLVFDVVSGMLALHVAALAVHKALLLWHAPQALVLFIGILLPLAVVFLALKYVAPYFTPSQRFTTPRDLSILSEAA